MGGGAFPGNQNGVKIKSPDLRQKAYKQYCEWLSLGKSGRSFTFEEGDLMCTGKTIESYIANYPLEFPPVHKELAKSKGMAKWEQLVEDSAVGINQKANTASLQMLMRNKFGWDKQNQEQETNEAHVVSIAKGVRSEPVSEAKTSN
jgi:hypothetical protein